MMIIARSLVVTGALLVFGFEPPVRSQQPIEELSLAVLFLDPPPANGMATMWLVIKNHSQIPRVFCRQSWSYMWMSADPNGPAGGEVHTSLHGCGDRDWLLLPNESRLDPVEIKSPSERTARLDVDVEVVERSLGSDAVLGRHTLTWKGKVSDAVALGEKLKSNPSK